MEIENNIMHYDAIIIGGGPAGMLSAIRAGERGRKILLIERNNSLGRKLLITGGGRCNITNIRDRAYFLEKFSQKGTFLRNAFAQYFNTDLLKFFQDTGLNFKEEGDGCIFPATDKAEDILSILKSKLADNNVKVILGERVKDIIFDNNSIKGATAYSGNKYYAPHLVIATGGLSYSETGSTGDGYAFAKKLKHHIVPLKPALVPIEIKEGFITARKYLGACSEDESASNSSRNKILRSLAAEYFIKDWQGISLKNIKVSVFKNNKIISTESGDLIFTHFGLSGPVILDLSADIDSGSSLDDVIRKREEAVISINFLPFLNHAQLNDLILKELKKSPNRQLKNLLDTIIPKNMTEQFLKYCAVPPDKKSCRLTSEERKCLLNNLFDFRLTVRGTRPIKEAMVTRGGISTDEINPKTMESKLVKGLFFAGEIIDIDAKTGGYNLQAAFSTGWVAGNNI